MAQERSAEAVVLRRSDSGEADRRLTLLTREYGKLDVIAKGARKSGSRLAGSSDPLVRAVFTWAEGRVRRFVMQVQPLSSYPTVRSDYDRTLAALALAESAAIGVPYESPCEDVFDTVVEGLARLDEGLPVLPVSIWTQARLLEAEGVHPAWVRHVSTGAPMDENPAWVSPRAGGLVSGIEAEALPDARQVPSEALIALSRVASLREPPSRVSHASECLQTLFAFWRHYLENRLPANEAFVQSVTAL